MRKIRDRGGIYATFYISASGIITFLKLLILCNGFVSLSLAHSLLDISVVASYRSLSPYLPLSWFFPCENELGLTPEEAALF